MPASAPDSLALFDRSTFFFQNVVKAIELKTQDKLDIYGDDGTLLLECREPDLGGLTKVARSLGGQYNEVAAIVPFFWPSPWSGHACSNKMQKAKF